MTKREFLKILMLRGSGVLLGGMALSSQARALEILKKTPIPVANELQLRLLSEPERRTLLAELAECVFTPPPYKMKCLMANS